MHSNLASFKKPKIQLSQCQDAQTPNMPVSKQPTFIMPTFKTASVKNASFVVSRLVVNIRIEIGAAGQIDRVLGENIT
jgi:hypothetical protein